MSDSRDTHEPSMEEILSSIRRIIAEEEGEEPAPSASSAGGGGRETHPEPALGEHDEASEDDEDVLDLTQRLEDDGEVVDLNARAAEVDGTAADEGEPIEEVELQADEPEFQPEPTPEAAAADAGAPAAVVGTQPQQPEQKGQRRVAANQPNQRSNGPLVDEGAAGAAGTAFARFAQAVAPTPSDQRVATSEGRTVEEFAEDILRPILKDWLDENLPAIVERVVEREISKIARRAELL